MTKMPDWDFFGTYRTYGGYDQLYDYVIIVRWRRKLHYVKSNWPLTEGSRVQFYSMGSHGLAVWKAKSTDGVRKAKPPNGICTGTVVQIMAKKDFCKFNLSTATAHEVTAVGHFMCGGPLHGQWLGELLLQMRALAQACHPPTPPTGTP